ncbi:MULTISPECIES: hypothetical protein [unclassified Spirillospora]|uniref:hypothetical protein n=1 Tax=unclassified Spirillospora TaxID=2642701 RepID=UPI003714FEEE
MSVVPAAAGLVASLLGVKPKGYGVGIAFSLDQCGGWLHQTDVSSVPGYAQLSGRPYLVVVPAFLVWLVTRRRAVGWTLVAILGPVALVQPVLFGYDVARWGRTCVDLWLPRFPGWHIAWWTWHLVLVALILASVYRPGVRAVRVVSGALVMGMVLGIAGDQGPPRVVMASPDDCDKVRPALPQDPGALVQAMKRLSERERRLAYICSVRGYPERHLLRRYPAPEDPLSDAVLLHQGRRACRGEYPLPPADLGRRGVHWPSLREMAYLCPRTAAMRLREQERRRAALTAEYEREQARVRAYCKRTEPRGPEPVTEASEVASGGESSSYFVGSGGATAPRDGLVDAAGGSATVTTGTQGDFCLTVRAYRKAPPLALKGWDRVAEVGFESPDGRSTVGSVWGPMGMPVVTVAGPGRYRLRVYVRGRDEPEAVSPEMPAERHLLVVFPGRSKERKVFKNEEG